MAVGPARSGSVPLVVPGDLGEGSSRVDVPGNPEYCRDRKSSLWRGRLGADDYLEEDWVTPYNAILRTNQRSGTSMRSVGGELCVPREYKFLKLAEPEREQGEGDTCPGNEFDEYGTRTNPRLTGEPPVGGHSEAQPVGSGS